MICKIGTLCSLSCYATSEFPRTVAYSWTKDGRSLANSRKIKIIDNSIVIKPQYMEDYGVYVCRASNGIYYTTCNVTLVEIQEGQILTAAVKKMESDSKFQWLRFLFSCLQSSGSQPLRSHINAVSIIMNILFTIKQQFQ